MATINFNHQAISALKPPRKRFELFDERTKGLGLRITPSGTKTFFYRYRINGKIRRYTIGQFDGVSLKQARDEISRLRVKVLDGNDPQAERQQKKNTQDLQPFSYLADEFNSNKIVIKTNLFPLKVYGFTSMQSAIEYGADHGCKSI